jgi:hypothetical protein
LGRSALRKERIDGRPREHACDLIEQFLAVDH